MLDLSLWHTGYSAHGLSVLRRRSGLLGTALGGRAGVGGETIRFHFVLGTAQAAPEQGVLWAAGQWDEECESVFLCAPQTAANSSTTARTTNTAGRSNGSWMRAGTEAMVRHRLAALPLLRLMVVGPHGPACSHTLF